MFIAFDGIDGSGKSTQLELLTKYFDKRSDVKYNVLDFAGNGKFKPIIKGINKNMIETSLVTRELIYYFEGLYTNLETIEKLKKNEIVIIDRYYLTYLAFGQMHGLDREDILFFNKHLIEPDFYFLIDVAPEKAYERISKYRQVSSPEVGFENFKKLKEKSLNRDTYVNFQSNIRTNYLKEARSNHIILDGEKSPEILHAGIIKKIEKRLEQKK